MEEASITGSGKAYLRHFLFLSLCLCVSAVQCFSQDWKTVHPGVEYARVEHKLGSDPLKINLLRLDLTKVRLDVHHALDKAIGLETTSSIAKRKGAIAAINGGFFRLDKSPFAGDAAGTFAVDGRVLSESVNYRAVIGINNGGAKDRTEVVFGHLNAKALAGFGVDSTFTFDGINRERKANEIILFTPEFSTTTLTNANGIEVILTNCDRRPFRWCKNAKVVERNGNSTIPQGGFVISIANDALGRSNGILNFAKRNEAGDYSIFNILRVGVTKKSLDPSQMEFFSTAEDITNGVPQLIKNGKIDITWQQEKAGKAFVETRHPRTAVAKLKDGKFLMITVDGRQPGVSVGMNLYELADYLLSLGAADAMNLDGGGSTTMYLDGKVVNTPSDKEGERKIGDAILVTLRKPARK